MTPKTSPGPSSAMPRRDKRTERWKHLLAVPQRPRRIEADAYVAELNRRLVDDPAYRSNTRFVVLAPAADGSHRGGPTWEGPDDMKPTVCRLVNSVAHLYSVVPPFFFDR